MALRTTPRPLAQRGVRAVGATIEKKGAGISEPEINLKIKNKLKTT